MDKHVNDASFRLAPAGNKPKRSWRNIVDEEKEFLGITAFQWQNLFMVALLIGVGTVGADYAFWAKSCIMGSTVGILYVAAYVGRRI